MSHSCVWYDWSTRATSHSHVCHMGWVRPVGSLKLQVSFAKETCKRDDILQKTHNLKEPTDRSHPITSHTCNDSCVCVTWHIYTWGMSHSYVCHDSCTQATAHSPMWHDSSMHTMTHSQTWHDSSNHTTTRSHMWHDSSTHATTHSDTWHDSSKHTRTHSRLVLTCDMTHLRTQRDSFVCGTWLVHTCDTTQSSCDMTYPHMHRLILTCDMTHLRMQRLVLMFDMTHSYVWYDTFICVKRLIHTCDMTHPHMQRLIRTCDMTHRIVGWQFAHHCHALQHTATHGTTLQHTATHCNTRHHTAPRCTTVRAHMSRLNSHMIWIFVTQR